MIDFKIKVAELIFESVKDMTIEEISSSLEAPQNPKMGDCAFPCFKLSKLMKKAPQVIAGEIKQLIDGNRGEFIDKIEAAGGYLNFFFNKSSAAESVLNAILSEKENYGRSKAGGGKCIVIDYSSPNIAKPFHVGHLYTTFIGAALYNMYEFLGYKPFGINYLGDWGTQFGKMLYAYKHWSSEELVDKDGLAELTRVYVKYSAEAETNPALDNEARLWLVKMQDGDEEALRLWKTFRDLSLEEYNKCYKRLGISFDSYNGESFYNDKMAAVVEELHAKNLLVEDNGAKIVRLDEYKMPPCLILRSDGGTLYPTRDIASAIYRYKNYNFSKALYITDARQSLHFAQWFKVAGLMGYPFESDLVHIPYGYLMLEDGAMSTRKGNYVTADTVFNEAAARVKAVINEKNPELEHKDEVAEQVGIGAVKFVILYNSRIKDVVFSLDKILSFDGETGPYVQYTHARASGVLEKAGRDDFANPDYSLLSDDDSLSIVKLLSQFTEKVEEAVQKYEPYVVTRYVTELAQAYNKFYHNNKILQAEPGLRKARLALTYGVKTVTASALALLGISAPDRM